MRCLWKPCAMTSLHGAAMGEGNLGVDGQMWAPREPKRLDVLCLQPHHSMEPSWTPPSTAPQGGAGAQQRREGDENILGCFLDEFQPSLRSSPLGREERRWECARFAVLFFPGVFPRCEPELLCSSPAFPEQSVGTGPPLPPAREDTQPSHVLVLGLMPAELAANPAPGSSAGQLSCRSDELFLPEQLLPPRGFCSSSTQPQ